jgi:hypothetical protein
MPAGDVRQAARDRQQEVAQFATAPEPTGPGDALAIRAEQANWTPTQLAALSALGVKQATPGDLQVFFHVCATTGLNPYRKQIYMIMRMVWDQELQRKVPKQTIQVGIDGFRIVRDRAAVRQGWAAEFEETLWYDAEGKPYELWLPEEPPFACKVVLVKVYPDGRRLRVPKLIRWSAYVDTWESDGRNHKKGDPRNRWADDGPGMLEKCFSSDTEVLTEHGFRLFRDVGGARIAQVTDHGLELVQAAPFAQRYDGPMITQHSDRLDFCVTPNHDMVTTTGKVEAGTMLDQATYRPRWRIPMTAPGRTGGLPVPLARMQLAGYFLADGQAEHRQLLIGVSRPRKIAALNRLGLHARTLAKRDAGRVSTGGRPITTRADKVVFVYDAALLAGTGIGRDKTVSPDAVAAMSQEQARAVLDAWAEFDGHQQGPTRRLYTSRPGLVGAAELLAAAAGYTVNVPRKRISDLSARPNYAITVSATRPTAPVTRPWRRKPGIAAESNPDGWVWCVTVPSHQIIVRRNGMAMVCGQCAEAGASRRAAPEELSGLYIGEEMEAGGAPQPWRHREPVQATAEVIHDGEPGQQAEPERPPPPAGNADPDVKDQRNATLARIHILFEGAGWGDKSDDHRRLRRLVAANLGREADNDPLLRLAGLEDLDVWAAERVAERLDHFITQQRQPHAALQRMARAAARELGEDRS